MSTLDEFEKLNVGLRKALKGVITQCKYVLNHYSSHQQQVRRILMKELGLHTDEEYKQMLIKIAQQVAKPAQTMLAGMDKFVECVVNNDIDSCDCDELIDVWEGDAYSGVYKIEALKKLMSELDETKKTITIEYFISLAKKE